MIISTWHKNYYLHDILHVVNRDLPCRELPPGVAGESSLKLVQDHSSESWDAGGDDVGHLQELQANLLFIEQLLLCEVEDLVSLARRGLADHLAQRELDVLQAKC